MTQAIHKMGGNSVVTNTEAVLFADGTEQFTAFIEPVGSTTLYVDNDRTNSFTPDGTYLRPYPTIMGAVNRIVTNADNTASKAYVVQISGGNYVETIDLSNPALTNLVFVGNDAVLVGNNAMTQPVLQAINNDALVRCLFFGIEFALNGTSTHGINFSSTTTGTLLGQHGIVFTGCGIQDNTEDVYFNNVSFILFDNTGVTANIDVTNVNNLQFVNSNGPNPQTPFVITTNTGSPTPADWGGNSNAEFTGVGIGSITTDALSKVSIQNCFVSGVITDASTDNTFVILNSVVTGNITVNAGGILGIINSLVSQPTAPATATVTINGVLLSSLSFITGTPIVVNSGGAFIEAGGLHDDGQLTVNSGGAYASQGDMGVGNLNVQGHVNSIQADLAGQLTINGGTSTSFTFANAYTNAPIVTVTPTSDPTATGTYWVTTSPTGFSIFVSISGTLAFNYVVIGNGI
jgi:hypothetical protein